MKKNLLVIFYFVVNLLSAQEVQNIKKVSTNKGIQFVKNQNQWEASIQYRADLPQGFLFIKENSIQYSFYENTYSHPHHSSTRKTTKTTVNAHSFTVNFVKANPHCTINPWQIQKTKYHYLLGSSETQWAFNVPAYQEIHYEDIYPGIELSFYANANHLKYEFIVGAGADPDKIQMEYKHVDDLYLKDGDLYITTSVNTMMEKKPYVYQIIKGKKVVVPSAFKLRDSTVSFEFPEGYDVNYELIIDPDIVFSTFSGSVSDNWGNTATYDSEGNLYSGGTVFGANFPVTEGAFQMDTGGASTDGRLCDIAILKYNKSGTDLLYASFLGGRFSEVPHSLVVDSNDNLVIFGTTGSDDFPIHANAYDDIFNGGTSVNPLAIQYPIGTDLFVTKLSADGSNLLGSTYFGGDENDGLKMLNTQINNYGDELRGEVYIDEHDAIYIASTTTSAFINNVNGNLQGSQDGLILKFNEGLSALIWGRFFGGNDFDTALSLKINSREEVLVAGTTRSNNLVQTAGAYQENLLGEEDGYIAKLDTHGNLLACTYMGTAEADQIYLLDLDVEDNVYVLGLTNGNYPVSNGVYHNAGGKQFIHKLSSDLVENAGSFSTVFGSGRLHPDLSPTAFLVNECGHIYFSGWGGIVNNGRAVDSRTTGLPVTENAFKSTTQGDDFYILVLDENAQDILYATFFGSNSSRGDHVDGGTSRFSKDGTIYHATCSCLDGNGQVDFPTTPGAWSVSHNSNNCNNAAFKFITSGLEADFNMFSEQGVITSGDLSCSPEARILFTGYGEEQLVWEISGPDINGSELIQNIPDFDYTFPAEGEYTIRLTVTNPESCVGEANIVKTLIVSNPQFRISNNVNLCLGESTRLEASGGVSYHWEPQEGLSDPDIANPIASPNSTTQYRVTITNDFGCVGQEIVRVGVSQLTSLDVNLSITQECNDQWVNFENNTQGANTFFWDMGDGTMLTGKEPESYQYAASGSYTVVFTARDQFGCTLSEDIRIDIQDLNFQPEFSASPDSAISCSGEGVQLGASGGVSYHWEPQEGLSDPNIADPVAVPQTSTNYTVQIVDENGCRGEEQVSVLAGDLGEPDIALRKVLDCHREMIVFENNTPGAEVFSWDMGNGEVLNEALPSPYLYEEAGSYTITFTATDALGCQKSQTLSIDILDTDARPPNVITPNADGINDTFVLPGESNQLKIYNRWGNLLFQTDNYLNDWGKDMPAGTYYYLITSPIGNTCKGWIQIMK